MTSRSPPESCNSNCGTDQRSLIQRWSYNCFRREILEYFLLQARVTSRLLQGSYMVKNVDYIVSQKFQLYMKQHLKTILLNLLWRTFVGGIFLSMHYLWSLGINKSPYLGIHAVATCRNRDFHVQPIARFQVSYQALKAYEILNWHTY